MKITNWTPKEGCNGLKHRREKHFTSEVSVIWKDPDMRYVCPITIRAYRSGKTVSFCLWVHFNNKHASGSAISTDCSIIYKVIHSAGFTFIELLPERIYDIDCMTDVVQALMDYFLIDGYIHVAHP